MQNKISFETQPIMSTGDTEGYHHSHAAGSIYEQVNRGCDYFWNKRGLKDPGSFQDYDFRRLARRSVE